MNTHNAQQGQSLIEVLVALGVFTIGIVAIGLLMIDAGVSFRQGAERTRALFLAEEGLAAARSLRDADFDNVTAGTHGIALSGNRWVFSGSSDTQDQFTRTVTVTDVATGTKQVVSAVTWQFTPARQSAVTLTTYLADWRQAKGLAGELSVDISGAALTASSSDQLIGVTLEHTGAGTSTIDKMKLSWGNSNTLYRIRIDGTDVYNVASTSGVLSGTEVDITDFVFAEGSGVKNMDTIAFNGSMVGTDFIIEYVMSDGSTHHSLLDL